MARLFPSLSHPFHSTGIKISILDQQLFLYSEHFSTLNYPISSSRFGLGTLENSLCTPLGRFQIAKKIGTGFPVRADFRHRLFTGEIADLGGEEDRILSRILWLNGLELENANTYQRYIYIHGTNQESQIGSPASHGCIRMCNTDIVELFEYVVVGTPVEILESI